MPEYVLISHHLCPYVQRAAIVCEEKQIPCSRKYIDFTQKPEWFLALSPLGKVPVLCVDGKPLFESAVICEYLDEITEGSLHPADPFARAEHRAWIEVASAILRDMVPVWNARTDEDLGSAAQAVHHKFEQLAEVVAGPYFAGPDFSMVDAAFGPAFRAYGVIEKLAGIAFFENLAPLKPWRTALAERPSVQGAVLADYEERFTRFLRSRGDTAIARRLSAS